MGFFNTFRNMLRGNREFKENPNGTVTDLTEKKPRILAPYLIAYVRDDYSARIYATLVLTKDGKFGVAYTAKSNDKTKNERKSSKKEGQAKALERANGIKDFTPIPNHRGEFFVKGTFHKNLEDAVYHEAECLLERGFRYYEWNPEFVVANTEQFFAE